MTLVGAESAPPRHPRSIGRGSRDAYADCGDGVMHLVERPQPICATAQVGRPFRHSGREQDDAPLRSPRASRPRSHGPHVRADPLRGRRGRDAPGWWRAPESPNRRVTSLARGCGALLEALVAKLTAGETYSGPSARAQALPPSAEGTKHNGAGAARVRVREVLAPAAWDSWPPRGSGPASTVDGGTGGFSRALRVA